MTRESAVARDMGTDGVEVEFSRVLLQCIGKLRQTMPVFGLRNPKIGKSDLSWDFCGTEDWVAGFYSAQLWLAYQSTGDNTFANFASARRPYFQNILTMPHAMDHDLGFQFFLTSVMEHNLRGDDAARDMALRAADILRARFKYSGEYIEAWSAGPKSSPEWRRSVVGRSIADTMMNVSLLYWAHRQTGEQSYVDVATAHSHTTAKYIVRDDGSSYHTFTFDPFTGAPVGGSTHQGFADESCWSRGQAWLIYGFAQTYGVTGDKAFLDTAIALAAYVEAQLEKFAVPLWDYRLTEGEEPYLDSSAGAITAAGLYILAGELPDDAAVRWRALAGRILTDLVRNCDVSGQSEALGLLDQGAGHVKQGRANNMLPYGDYYYMEALIRASGLPINFD